MKKLIPDCTQEVPQNYRAGKCKLFKTGDVVLVYDDTSWKMAVIEELVMGK